MSTEKDIDWGFSKDQNPSWTGEYHGHISFNRKSKFFAIKFNKGTPEDVFNADGLSFGLKNDEVYISSNRFGESPFFKLRTHKNGYKIITRKILVSDITTQLLGKLPKEKASIQFNLKHCTGNIWRVVDQKLI